MTIDEEIAHARAIAKYKRKKLDKCIKKNIYACKFCNEIRTCKEVVEEQEQLEEWLEELKVYQQHKIICNKGYNAGYNKAIDDFAADIINKINFEDKWLFDCKSNNADTNIAFSALRTFVNERAEQLKAGGKNESIQM